MIREVERDPTIVGAEAFEASPHDLACRAQFVQIRRSVRFHSATKYFFFPDRGGEHRALELFDRIEQAIESASRLSYALPDGQKATKCRLIDGLHLFAKLCE